ncbi:MAG: tetratricopeptide repeat protein [Armatimonadota bacterium]|nr:tetratricopeptide repeat protein [Armatimonadota bacterium]MCX7777785.1 tetratricopeptide repeat protein [Armatimonadota bacterium]MDW8025328.1 tetratricopeptide repeat protein [Armatimonadota bacterium]
MRRRLRKLANAYACFLIAILFIIGTFPLVSSERGEHKCIQAMRSFATNVFGIFNRLNASRHVRAAERMLSEGNLSGAEAHLQNALKLDPKSFAAYLHLVTLHLIRKDVKGADEVLKRAKAYLPTEQLSYLYTTAGDCCAFFVPMDVKVMERYYREALKLYPKNATALNNYGYALAERGIKLDEAERMIKSALKLEPNNAAFIDSLGWVYYKQGRYDEAVKWLEKAVGLQSNDAELRYHLGMAYIAVGRIDEARLQLEEALRINPKHVGANEALKELEREQEKIRQREKEPTGEMA